MQELQNGTTLQEGKYRIEKMLGQGGFGITYKAVMKGSVTGSLGGMTVNIPVVLKEFFMDSVCLRVDGTRVSVPSTGSKEQTDRYRQKFIKEANNIASLSHPNIVQVMDVFEENGTVYYVMEYLEGGSLRQMMDKGALPEAQALEYVRQIGSALQYMHEEKHLCHLDVKPGNIMLTADGQAKLIDFGISKGYDKYGNETSSTPVGLSPGYAPLEQYQNALQDFSPVTDIYSLGATLLALLTGQVPPEASIVNEDGLGSCPPYISQKVWQAINAAMQPKRKDRPQHVSTFLDILDNGLPEATRRVDDQPDVPTTPIAPTPAPHPAPQPAPAPFPKSETNWTKYVVIVAIAALIGGGIFWVANNGGGKKEQQEQAAAVQTTDEWELIGNYHEGLAYVRDTNGKCGYIDKTGQVVIPCKWEGAESFSEGLALVQDANGKVGYIDQTGRLVIPCQWKEAWSFSEGLANVKDFNDKWGFIDKTGKVVLPCTWENTGDFSEGLAVVGDANDKWGYIDKTGRLVIPCQWKSAYSFSEGLAWVRDANGNWFKIDKTGKVVEPTTTTTTTKKQTPASTKKQTSTKQAAKKQSSASTKQSNQATIHKGKVQGVQGPGGSQGLQRQDREDSHPL